MSTTNINVSSEIDIVCGNCGSNFSGKALYAKQVLELFNNHVCNSKPAVKDKGEEHAGN